MAEGIIKVTEDDPRRCQAVNSQGQCRNQAVEGGTNCICHGGNKQLESQKRQGLRNYRLTMFQAQLEQMSESSAIKSLRDEVGIMRMMMQEKLNAMKGVNELLMYSGPIADLAMKIKDIVVACDRLERSTGQMLDKQAILQFASEVVGIVSKHITDPDVLTQISDEIIEAVGNTGSKA